MALHPSFPTSAYAPLIREERWFPANEDLRSTAYEKLLPPNGHEGRNWRDGFKLDYVKANGDLANYVPDFILRATDGKIWLVATKGRAELDLPQKTARLKRKELPRSAPGRLRNRCHRDQQPPQRLFQTGHHPSPP